MAHGKRRPCCPVDSWGLSVRDPWSCVRRPNLVCYFPMLTCCCRRIAAVLCRVAAAQVYDCAPFTPIFRPANKVRGCSARATRLLHGCLPGGHVKHAVACAGALGCVLHSVLARIGGASFWSFFECDRSCGLTGMGGHGISNVSGKRKRA